MATKALKTVAGNTAPPYQITCKRDDGSIINLTNCIVSLKLTQNGTQTNAGHENTSVTILTPAAGLIQWTPQAGDIPAAGQLKGDVKVTYTDGTFEILYGQLVLKARAAL